MDLLRHGARRAAHLADDRHQRADDQGHARAHRRRRASITAHRQGAAGGHHRRRAARGRSHASCRIRPADRLARARPGINGIVSHRPTAPADRSRCRALQQPDAVRHPARRACRRSTTACSRPTRTRARWRTRSCARRTASPAQARFGEQRAGAGRRRSRRSRPAARRSSRSRRSTTRTSASTSTSRRARTTTTTCRCALKIAVTQHLRDRVRRAADVRQPRDQHDHPAARRRDEHAGRA